MKITTATLSKASWDELSILFKSGRPPAVLNGFYPGKLLHTRMNPVTDFFVGFLKHRLIPWKGKSFDSKKRQGFNIVSRKAAVLFRWQYPQHETKKNGRIIEVFPFKIGLGKSLTDKKKRVLLIQYDNPKNPPGVRRVTDEMVNVGKDLYLGRAQVRSGRSARTVAYFFLKKS